MDEDDNGKLRLERVNPTRSRSPPKAVNGCKCGRWDIESHRHSMLLNFRHIYCYYLISVVLAVDNDIVRDIQSGKRHIPCRLVIFHIEYLTCEIIDKEDHHKINPYIRTGCDSDDVVCENTEVKTCQPVVTLNTLSYKCFCRSLSANDREISNANLIPWQALSRHMRGFTYNRQISGGHPATEYSKKPLRFIISH